MDDLIADHGLDGHSTVELRQHFQDFAVTRAAWLTPTGGSQQQAPFSVVSPQGAGGPSRLRPDGARPVRAVSRAQHLDL